MGRSTESIRSGLSVLTVALLAFGCADSDDAGAAFEPIEGILGTDIEITADPSGTSAVLAVETTIPLACAVIYGTDESFGSIAVDNDMQGGAHRDHHPLLGGLEPDTEYQYVLQGSDAAGTVYRSETLTFRTPPGVDTGLGANIAPTGAVNAVSSEFSAAFAADNVLDGDLGSEWSTRGDGDDAWIEIDLGEAHEIAAVAFRTRQMADGSAITDTFTVAIDGETLGPFAAGPDAVVLDSPTTGRVLRFDADDTTGGNTGATEIEIYGSRR